MNFQNLSKPKKRLVIGAAVGVFGGLIALVGILYAQKHNVDTQVTNLTAVNEMLKQQKAALSDQDTKPAEETDDTTSDDTPTNTSQPSTTTPSESKETEEPAKPVASMKVTAVKDQPGSDFGKPGYTAPQGAQRVVYVTLTNLSSAAATYTVNQFKVVTSTGDTVTPRIYSPVETKVWNSSQVAAGESESVQLLFDPANTLDTLKWTPPSSDELTALLPNVQ